MEYIKVKVSHGHNGNVRMLTENVRVVPKGFVSKTLKISNNDR